MKEVTVLFVSHLFDQKLSKGTVNQIFRSNIAIKFWWHVRLNWCFQLTVAGSIVRICGVVILLFKVWQNQLWDCKKSYLKWLLFILKSLFSIFGITMSRITKVSSSMGPDVIRQFPIEVTSDLFSGENLIFLRNIISWMEL